MLYFPPIKDSTTSGAIPLLGTSVNAYAYDGAEVVLGGGSILKPFVSAT